MADKIKLAVYWAASCGGCDVSLLDTEEKILDLAALADIVYWPVAMDFKWDQVEAMPDKSIDMVLFNGAIRTDEQAEGARILRRKAKVLCAYGSCACFGGIPGLGNLSSREELLDTAYQTTVSTENPGEVRPQPVCQVKGNPLTLPSVLNTVSCLADLVEVDLFMPGCPPPNARNLDLIAAVAAYASTGELPPKGAYLAEDKALCDSCPRKDTRQGGRMAKIARPHEILVDPEKCFLDQGLICMGMATRGGCEATCIQANMPCRGCFGPTPDMLDPGAEAMSAIGSIAGEAHENDVPAHVMKKTIRSIRDPAGTFYRYTLPKAFLNHKVSDQPAKETP